MAEKSYLWTTGGAGDGANEYTRTDWAMIGKIFSSCLGAEGVARGFMNQLLVTNQAANTARVATGGAMVDGKPYSNDTAVDVHIPSAVGGGNTRIDRIVLRADWTAQTVRIHRIAGVDAGAPTAPAIIQNSGVLYDLPLARVLVDTGGNLTITDERVFSDASGVPVGSLSGTGPMVVGKPNAGVGPATEILAATNERLLRRVSDVVDFGQLTLGMIPDLLITTAKIANDAIDDTKVGNRVPQFYRRQGGNAVNWNIPGFTTYTPSGVRMQAGTRNVVIPAGSSAYDEPFFFPVAFSAQPLVFATPIPTGEIANAYPVVVSAVATSTSQAVIRVHWEDTGQDRIVAVHWLAIGPE